MITPVQEEKDQGLTFDEALPTAEGSGPSNPRKRPNPPRTPTPPLSPTLHRRELSPSSQLDDPKGEG
jgi:hypothetical protein